MASRSSVGHAKITAASDSVMPETCWFCGMAPAEIGESFEAPLCRDVKRLASRRGNTTTREVQFTPGKVSIPRCLSCSTKHRRRRESILYGMGIAVLVWLAIFLWSVPADYRNIGTFALVPLFFALWGFFLGYGIGVVIFPTRGVASAKTYPGVTSMLQSGWSYGKPQPGGGTFQPHAWNRESRSRSK